MSIFGAYQTLNKTIRSGDAYSQKANKSLICFSHLRWAFVFQRPQHLMSRFSQEREVFFFEEPIFSEEDCAHLQSYRCDKSGVLVVTPVLRVGMRDHAIQDALKTLLDGLIADHQIERPLLWFYTPTMYPLSRHIDNSGIIYDCMDELASFRFASPNLPAMERDLMRKADVMFTGGHSLFEAKRPFHRNIHAFPSGVDQAHFSIARRPGQIDPEDQAEIPHPRLGFFGVVDERLNLELIGELADKRPDWSIVIVGPVVKIAVEDLPVRANIYYLGGKSYEQLPAYLAGWDVALMPFAINEATRFISPTKTPEYLSGGKPVVSTPIADVIRNYGSVKGVCIAHCPASFVDACEEALAISESGDSWLAEVDKLLATLSWDESFTKMNALVTARSREVQTSVGQTNSAQNPVAKPRILNNRSKPFDDLIVGAGFAGSVLAERLADSGRRVLLIDRRPHIGGNAYDQYDAAGVLVHKYGPHIFHTNSEQVFKYLSRFTRWRPYEHRVLASTNEGLVPMPINRTTLNAIYKLKLNTDEEAQAFLASQAEPRQRIQTSEDVVISAVGRDLYNRFFRDYTRKQWGMDPSELDKSVTARVPTRANTDDRYFLDEFQAMPLDGYTRMFEKMLDHPNITVEVGTDFADLQGEAIYDRLIYTGPIDEYYGYRFGPLPYRSLSFRHETLDCAQFQQAAVINYPSADVPYTRITEYKHLTGQIHAKTSITYEYPTDQGDPYYPIPRPQNQALFKKYEYLASNESDVIFVGRLATYRYYNMDQVVAQALATYRRLTTSARTTIQAGSNAYLSENSAE